MNGTSLAMSILLVSATTNVFAKSSQDYLNGLRGGVDFSIVDELKKDPAMAKLIVTEGHKNEDPRVRRSCAAMARYIGDADLIEPLELYLTDSSADVRLDAASSLSEIAGEKALPLIIPLADDPDPILRASALSILAKLSKHKIIGLLRQKMHDDDPYVQLTSANLLASDGEPIPREFALNFIASSTSTPKIRAAAINLIGYIGNSIDLPMLDQIATKRGPNRGDAREAAAQLRLKLSTSPQEKASIIENGFKDGNLREWAQRESIRRYKHGEKFVRDIVKTISEQANQPGQYEAKQALELMDKKR